MTPQEQEINKMKSEIKKEVRLAFKANMKIFDWDIPENDDRKSAELIIEVMQEAINELKQEIANGDFNQYWEKTMSKSNLKHLETIKENIDKTDALSEEEKSDSFKRIEEWYNEDKAWDSLMAELSEISPKVKTFLAELGLI